MKEKDSKKLLATFCGDALAFHVFESEEEDPEIAEVLYSVDVAYWPFPRWLSKGLSECPEYRQTNLNLRMCDVTEAIRLLEKVQFFVDERRHELYS